MHFPKISVKLLTVEKFLIGKGEYMYTVIDYRSKKALKEAVVSGKEVRVYQPNDMFGTMERVGKGTHDITLEGPHYPKPHTWYAQATITDGIVVKVK